MVTNVIKHAQKFAEQWGEYIRQYNGKIHWRSKDKGIIIISHDSKRPMNGVDLNSSSPVDEQIKRLAYNIEEFPKVNCNRKREEEHSQQAGFVFDLLQDEDSVAIQSIREALNTKDIVFAGSEIVLYEGKGKFHTEHKQIMDVILVSPSQKRIYIVEMKKQKPSKNKNLSPNEQLQGYIKTYKEKEFFSSLCKLISCYSGYNVSEEYSMGGIIIQGYESNTRPDITFGEFVTFKF